MPSADANLGDLGHVLTKDHSAKTALSICTVNATSFKSLKKYLEMTTAHVVLAQELHVLGRSAIDVSKWLKGHGWKSLIADAVQGFRPPYSSGGVAILVRDNPLVGLGRVPGQPQVIAQGRMVAGLVNAIGNLTLVVYSGYLYESEGLSERNFQLLQAVAENAKGHALPWVLGADFNMPPDRLQQSGFLAKADAAIVHTKLLIGTCFQAVVPTTLDYFVMCSKLAGAVKDVRVQMEARTSPHRPVVLTFHEGLFSVKTFQMVQPHSIPLVKPFGPSLPPPDWARTRATVEAAARGAKDAMGESLDRLLFDAYKAWADTAELELATATDTPLPHRGLRGSMPRCC